MLDPSFQQSHGGPVVLIFLIRSRWFRLEPCLNTRFLRFFSDSSEEPRTFFMSFHLLLCPVWRRHSVVAEFMDMHKSMAS